MADLKQWYKMLVLPPVVESRDVRLQLADVFDVLVSLYLSTRILTRDAQNGQPSTKHFITLQVDYKNHSIIGFRFNNKICNCIYTVNNFVNNTNYNVYCIYRRILFTIYLNREAFQIIMMQIDKWRVDRLKKGCRWKWNYFAYFCQHVICCSGIAKRFC